MSLDLDWQQQLAAVSASTRSSQLLNSPPEGKEFYFFRLNLDLDLNFADPFLAPLLSRLLGSNSVNLYLSNGGQSDMAIESQGQTQHIQSARPPKTEKTSVRDDCCADTKSIRS